MHFGVTDPRIAIRWLVLFMTLAVAPLAIALTWSCCDTEVGDMSRHIAIVGARRRTDRETVERLVAGLPADTVIVSGGSIGPDTWAEEAARKHGLATKIFRPDLHDVVALSQGQISRYHARNQQIVDAADDRGHHPPRAAEGNPRHDPLGEGRLQ